MADKNYNDVNTLVNEWRAILDGKRRALLEEQQYNDDNAVPYANNEQIVTDVIESASNEFGAKFDKYEHPVVYIPHTEDVRVNGDIPSIAPDAKFEFHYRPEHAGEECILHTNTLILNEDVLSKLNKMYGVYKNWKGRTLDSMQDVKPMSMHNDNAGMQQSQQQQQQRQMVPGDDLD